MEGALNSVSWRSTDEHHCKTKCLDSPYSRANPDQRFSVLVSMRRSARGMGMRTRNCSDTAFEDPLPNTETQHEKLTGALAHTYHVDKVIKKCMTDG